MTTKIDSILYKDAQEYNLALAEALRQIPEFTEPEWVAFVKSGAGKSRPIEDANFWHKRAASILRQIHKNEIVGVNRLRTKFGNKKDRGVRPSRFVKGSGKIIRVILQQADAAGFTEKAEGKKKGRKLTKKGKEFLENIKLENKEKTA